MTRVVKQTPAGEGVQGKRIQGQGGGQGLRGKRVRRPSDRLEPNPQRRGRRPAAEEAPAELRPPPCPTKKLGSTPRLFPFKRTTAFCIFHFSGVRTDPPQPQILLRLLVPCPSIALDPARPLTLLHTARAHPQIQTHPWAIAPSGGRAVTAAPNGVRAPAAVAGMNPKTVPPPRIAPPRWPSSSLPSY